MFLCVHVYNRIFTTSVVHLESVLYVVVSKLNKLEDLQMIH